MLKVAEILFAGKYLKIILLGNLLYFSSLSAIYSRSTDIRIYCIGGK